jgi:predicted dehydrogenase
MATKWGILGPGRIANKLAAAISEANDAETVAVASRDQERAEAFARQYGIARAYGSYQELLDAPDVDAVYIALPNSLHAEWAIKAARAGKHILCEKPLATSVEDATAMFSAAREHGVWLMEAFMYRFHPQTLKLQELLAAGAVGQVKLVRVDFGFSLNRPNDVRWSAELDGGALADVGCYCVNLARLVMGSAPQRAFAAARQAETGVDTLLAGTLEYDGDALAQVACDFVSSFHQTAQIIGSDGVIDLERAFTMPPDQPSRVRLWRGAHFAPLELIEIPPANHYRLQVEGFARLIARGHAAGPALPEQPLAETLDNLRTIAALRASAREGHPVEVGA